MNQALEPASLMSGVQQILVAILVLLLSWIGYTVVTLQQTMAEVNVKMSMLIEKSRDIVPRSENERRWESQEKRSDVNSERVSKIEQFLIQRK